MELNNIALELFKLGRKQEALEYHRKSIAEARAGNDDELLSLLLFHTATSIVETEGTNMQEAYNLATESCKMMCIDLDTDQKEVNYAYSLNLLGRILIRGGYYEKALEKIERIIGLETINAGVIQNHIGSSLYNLGRYDESLKYQEKSYNIACKLMSHDDINMKRIVNNYASILEKLGDVDAAKQIRDGVVLDTREKNKYV